MALRRGEMVSVNEVVLVLMGVISLVVPPTSFVSSPVPRTAGIAMSIRSIRQYQVEYAHPPIFVARSPGG